MKKILLFLSVFMASLTLVPLLAPSVSLADTKSQIQGGINEANGGKPVGNAGKNIDDTIATALNLLTVAVGIVAVIMIVIAGFRYVTSGGSSDRVSAAKGTLLYAVIGVAVAALAQIIVQFVLNKTTNP